MKIQSIQLDDPNGTDTQCCLIVLQNGERRVYSERRGPGYWKRVRDQVLKEGYETRTEDWPEWIRRFL